MKAEIKNEHGKSEKGKGVQHTAVPRAKASGTRFYFDAEPEQCTVSPLGGLPCSLQWTYNKGSFRAGTAMVTDTLIDVEVDTQKKAKQPPLRFPPSPEVGTAPFLDKVKVRLGMRLAYGRYGRSNLWNRAVNENNASLAQRLLKTGVLPSPPDEGARYRYDEMTQMLFDSLSYRDGKVTQCLLDAGASPNQRTSNNYSDAPTHRAARLGNRVAVQAMLNHHADHSILDGNQFTPALAALDDFGHAGGTVEDRWAIAEAFLAAGADPHATTRRGHNLLDYALTDTAERVTWALSLGLTLADPQEALFEVLYSGRELLGESPSPYAYYQASGLARHRFNETPSVRWDRWAMVDLLVSAGASFAGHDSQGRTLFERGIDGATRSPINC
jgi:hypothetical protein